MLQNLVDVTSPIVLALSKTHVGAGFADHMDGVNAACFVGKVNHLSDVANDIKSKTCLWPKEVRYHT